MSEKKRKPNDPIPARVYAMIPTDSHTALILCRRRAKETGVFHWNLLTHKITVSQWLKSRIHESLSDITPDGKHFIYTANDKGNNYTAISKAPWIKATCFWWDGGFWGGGFLAYFVDMPFIMGDGETKEEAIKDVKSAFEVYVVSALKHNDRIVEPKHQTMAKRLNITIPNYLLEKIDAYTKNHNITRSAFIQQASKQLLQMQS